MKVLLAEDDALLADALSTRLGAVGYVVEHAANGAMAEHLLSAHPFDIAILDIGLPLLDGLTVLRRLRVTHPTLPVLVLTARDALDDRVSGLQAGADDYVTKPFDFPELEARLHALLRRSQPASHAFQLRRLQLDREARRAAVAGETIDLSGREWSLLELLATQRDKVVTKHDISQIWGGEGGEIGNSNSIEVYIHRLRRKLEGSGLAIRTVRGLGYLLEDDEHTAPATRA